MRRRLAAAALAGFGLLAAATGGPAAAEVDRDPALGPVAWGATCVPPGARLLHTAYGRGWGVGVPVRVAVLVGGAEISAAEVSPVAQPDRGGTFQVRLDVTMPPEAPNGVVLRASQGTGAVVDQAMELSADCRPSLSARAVPTCTEPGRATGVEVSGGGWPPRSGPLKHYVDLFGAAERIDRNDRDHGSYLFVVGVEAPPSSTVAVTAEAPLGDGFRYATALVEMPPACTTPGSAGTLPTTVPTRPPGPGPGAGPGPGGPIVPTVPPPVLGAATLVVRPALGRPGETAKVRGIGFPPNAPVVLRWQPGVGQWTATTGGDGSFETQVLVMPKDPVGPRRLLASAGPAAPSARYLVVPASESPAGFEPAVFIRG